MGCMVAMLVSCNDNKPWEYKVVKVAGKEAGWQPDYGTMVRLQTKLPCSTKWEKKVGNS